MRDGTFNGDPKKISVWEGGRTNERSGTDCVTLGPMRGLKKLHPMEQADRQTDRLMWQLYDGIGPVEPYQ